MDIYIILGLILIITLIKLIWKERQKMNFYDYYNINQINDICWYYGQIMDNLSYNQIALLIEKYENENNRRL